MPEIDVINQFIDPVELKKQEEMVITSANAILAKFKEVNAELGNSTGIQSAATAYSNLNKVTTEAATVTQKTSSNIKELIDNWIAHDNIHNKYTDQDFLRKIIFFFN